MAYIFLKMNNSFGKKEKNGNFVSHQWIEKGSVNAANKERGSGGGNFREMETTIHTNNILLYPSPLVKIEENWWHSPFWSHSPQIHSWWMSRLSCRHRPISFTGDCFSIRFLYEVKILNYTKSKFQFWTRIVWILAEQLFTYGKLAWYKDERTLIRVRKKHVIQTVLFPSFMLFLSFFFKSQLN